MRYFHTSMEGDGYIKEAYFYRQLLVDELNVKYERILYFLSVDVY